MKDLAWQLLHTVLNTHGGGPALWLVDENISAQDIAAVKVVDTLQAVTNRYDVYQALQAKGFNARLSDYDFSEFEARSFSAIYYRVSKEKAVVHHIINAAARYLKPLGELYLAGYKNEGIKTYSDKAANLLANPAEKHRGSRSTLLATIVCADVDQKAFSVNRLDDKHYTDFATINAGELELVTKPGVFGWQKIDQGSAFLIDYLKDHMASLPQPESVVDLGCGYGYLSVMASQFLPARYVATDNNITAVNSCAQNFSQHHIDGEVLIDNCAQSINTKADLVLCNPPFHQGFDIDSDLTLRFLQSCKRLLNAKGVGLFVVNGFIPLEKKAAPLFSRVEVVASNRSFKLVLLSL
ncbi:methyltransferase [Oceanicoccus sagamiensis]|uniref:Methyltransferase small domain-containing protein n=1 Tax=Oceanicoccus sagamiensis TaxID=716816 RepID=A0A1X9NAH8_9GAMM|nr:methyltransferase [Oceanicoccus sagamiensis]ARN74626.1 hypothetical protein BST96_11130 [Oceanicoccus sagamiensis]